MPSCTYCPRPAFAGGKRRPLCEPHFDLWLIASHLKRIGLPVMADTIQAEMIAHPTHAYSFALDQAAELLAQLDGEIKTA